MTTLLLVIIWVCFWAYWFASAIGSKKRVLEKGWQNGAYLRVVASIIILIALHFRLVDLRFTPPGLVAATIGVALTALGLGICVWARRHLGRNWGMPMSHVDGADLVTSGPYHFVRHPIYSGLLLAILGTVLATDWALLVVLVIVGVFFIYSATTEEQRMTKLFPKDYAAYKAASKMLIPFVF